MPSGGVAMTTSPTVTSVTPSPANEAMPNELRRTGQTSHFGLWIRFFLKFLGAVSCDRLSLAYCCDGTIAFATETKRSATHIGRNGTHCHQHITYAYPNIQRFPTCKFTGIWNQVAEIQGPKRTVNLDFSFLRNSSLATSTPQRDINWSVTVEASLTSKPKEEAGLLSKLLKSQSPPRMVQTWKRHKTSETWRIRNRTSMCVIVMSTCLDASCGAGFSAGTAMCWSSFKSPPKCKGATMYVSKQNIMVYSILIHVLG